MASPGDPSDPRGAQGSVSAGDLNADDLDRIAASFRPSWEPDQAPFTGPGSLSASDIRALQGAEVHADVRATVAARSGSGARESHAPPKPTVLNEPTELVIVQAGTPPPATAVEIPPSVRPAPVPVPIDVPTKAPSVRPPAAMVAAPAVKVPSVRPAPILAVAPARPPLPSIDLEDSPFGRRSKKPLWIVLGIAGVALAGLGILATTSGGLSSETAPSGGTTAAATPVLVPAPAASPSSVPSPPEPPPAEPRPVVQAAPTTAPSRPQAAAPVTPPAVVAPPPSSNGTQSPAAAPAARAPTAPSSPRPAPASKASAHPKAGTTIVRDVPF